MTISRLQNSPPQPQPNPSNSRSIKNTWLCSRAQNSNNSPMKIVELPTKKLSSRIPWVKNHSVRSFFGMRLAAYEFKACNKTQQKLCDATRLAAWDRLSNFWKRAETTFLKTKSQVTKAPFIKDLAEQYLALNEVRLKSEITAGNKKAVKIMARLNNIIGQDEPIPDEPPPPYSENRDEPPPPYPGQNGSPQDSPYTSQSFPDGVNDIFVEEQRDILAQFEREDRDRKKTDDVLLRWVLDNSRNDTHGGDNTGSHLYPVIRF